MASEQMTNPFDCNREGAGTKEWSENSFNIGIGCSCDCLYCYARELALKFAWIQSPADWSSEQVNLDKAKKKQKKLDGVVMFPTMHDITPAYLEGALLAIRNLIDAGNYVLVVTKAHLECVQSICEEFREDKDKILFRFTIGSRDSEVLSYWEPGAPSYHERLNSLKHAHEAGFQTSVSVEPMLEDRLHTIVLINEIYPYVTDTIWIGKMNKIRERVKPSTPNLEMAVRAREIFQQDKEIKLLYEALKDVEKVRWKDSIKRVVGA